MTKECSSYHINPIVIRELKLQDIPELYKMYRSLSEESKRFFHPFPERVVSASSFLTWIPLALSCIRSLRRILLRISSSLAYISVCSLYSDKLIGFAFIRFRSRLYGNLGIVVRDDFQGMGVGSRLMHYLIILARREGIKRVRLTVLADNYKAIKLYEKFGFKKTRFIKEGDIYKGKKYDCIEMWLDL